MGATGFLEYRPRYQIGEKVFAVDILMLRIDKQTKSCLDHAQIRIYDCEIVAHHISGDGIVKYMVNAHSYPIDEDMISTNKIDLIKSLVKKLVEEF